MFCRFFAILLFVSSFAFPVYGFEVGAKIHSIDVAKRTASVFAGGKDRTVMIATDAKILGANGGPLAGGLSTKELKQGTVVTLAVEPVAKTPTIVAIRLGGSVNHAGTRPKPYAYEGAFVVRWLIRDQLDENAAKAPLLLWGPYFWADGLTPRQSDGLVWLRNDLVNDGAHPSNSGRQKVAGQLLTFFKTDDHAKMWFVKR